MKYFDEIYKLQHELNMIIGRDTVNDENKIKWSVDYNIALSSEAQELTDCINWKWWSVEGHNNQYKKIIDLENAKVEAIDCLHFLMSLIQIYDLPVDQFLDYTKNEDINNETLVFSLATEIKIRCCKNLSLHNRRFDYTNTNIFNIEKTISEIKYEKFCSNNDVMRKLDDKIYYENNKLKCWHNTIFMYWCLCKIFKLLKMSDEDILKIYQMKHKKNILRQKNKYSIVTKTEDDNNEIKEKIKLKTN